MHYGQNPTDEKSKKKRCRKRQNKEYSAVAKRPVFDHSDFIGNGKTIATARSLVMSEFPDKILPSYCPADSHKSIGISSNA